MADIDPHTGFCPNRHDCFRCKRGPLICCSADGSEPRTCEIDPDDMCHACDARSGYPILGDSPRAAAEYASYYRGDLVCPDRDPLTGRMPWERP